MKSKGSPGLIREQNSSFILDILKERAPVSKYEIAKTTGLSAPAVTKIMRDLIKTGFVKEAGTGESIGGRPPVLLDLNREGGFIIGVGIGNDEITALVTDFLCDTVSRSVTPLNAGDAEFTVLNKIIGAISDSVKKSGKEWSRFLGMGIGVPGDVDSEEGIVRQAARLNWKNVPLKSIIEKSFHIPAYIDESIRLISLAEISSGTGREYKDIICVRLGDEISAGIIIGGEIFSGSSGKAGKGIGHLKVGSDGPECTCGGTGCLQSLVSGYAVTKRAKELLESSGSSILYKSLKTKTKAWEITVKAVADAAKAGDEAGLKVMDETARYLAIAISNLTECFDPEIVVISGGIAQTAGEALFNPLIKHLDNFMTRKTPKLRVVLSNLGQDACALGAASAVLRQIFSAPKKHFHGAAK